MNKEFKELNGYPCKDEWAREQIEQIKQQLAQLSAAAASNEEGEE